jgi:hypothetical protein
MRLSHKFIYRFSRYVPAKLRAMIRSAVSLKEYDIARRIEANPYRDMPQENYQGSEFCLGIIEDVMQYHKYYIAACRDMKVSYRVLSILQSNWVEVFRDSDCDAFLVWPSNMPTSAKEAFDYRLNVLEKEMGAVIYPTWKECWLSEHKPRLRDWLEANDIPHPQTWVFYDKQQALQFAKNTPFPVVVKTATGASASGISIVHNQKQLAKAIRLAFGRGLRPKSFAPNDRQWGYIYIQKYFPKVKEWRMVRIGDSYFGYRKEPGPSGIHSASKSWSWLDPGKELLDLLREVTEKGNFTSMDVDIFLTQEDRLLVSECQTIFGCTTPAIQMKVNDKAARYLYENGQWKLEEGDFCQNHMCNLRIEYLLSKLRSAKTD